MNTVPPSNQGREADKTQLNPALKQVRDATYGPDQQGTDPMASVSVKNNQTSYWPAIWAGATIICVAVALILIFF